MTRRGYGGYGSVRPANRRHRRPDPFTATVKATGQVLDTYQAIVVKNLTLPFRVQLLHLGSTDPKANGSLTQTVAQASADIMVANIYLRQIGVTLVPDTDVKTQPEAPTKLIDPKSPGYFQQDVDRHPW